MYKDRSLIPAEAVRLAALGLLFEQARPYDALASEVRQFVGRVVGPSLDLLGPPLELLRIEGLVGPDSTEATVDRGGGRGNEPALLLTDRGRDELVRLLGANLRGPLGEFNKLVIALKLRFLEALPPEERAGQLDLMAEACERELARLRDLRKRSEGLTDLFVAWLYHDIAQIGARAAWFRNVAGLAGDD